MIKYVKIEISDTMKSKRRFMIFISIFMLMSVSSVFGQAMKTLTGTVTDLLGEPLIGVSIVIKGTTNGTVTDIDGKIFIKYT